MKLGRVRTAEHHLEQRPRFLQVRRRLTHAETQGASASEQDAWTIVLVVLFAAVGGFALAVGLLEVAVTLTAGGQP
jgi:hypothetical protein